MRKAITLRAFPQGMTTLERVKLAKAAGFEGIEINLEPGEEFDLDADKDVLTKLRRNIEAVGMYVSSVYSRQQWSYPITSQNLITRKNGQEIITRLAWAATILGADAVLVIPGAVDNSIFVSPPEIVPYEIAYQNSQQTLIELASTVIDQYGVILAVENVWNKFLQSPLEFARFIDEIASPWIGIYFDVGNVLRFGYPEDWIPILGTRIKRIHLKDFRLSVDNIGGFVNLLEGDVNWPAVKKSLEYIDYNSWITAEVLPAYKHYGERLIFDTSAAIDEIFTKEE